MQFPVVTTSFPWEFLLIWSSLNLTATSILNRDMLWIGKVESMDLIRVKLPPTERKFLFHKDVSKIFIIRVPKSLRSWIIPKSKQFTKKIPFPQRFFWKKFIIWVPKSLRHWIIPKSQQCSDLKRKLPGQRLNIFIGTSYSTNMLSAKLIFSQEDNSKHLGILFATSFHLEELKITVSTKNYR